MNDNDDMIHSHRPDNGDHDQVLIEALAARCTFAQAGAIAGVSERTVARRLESPTFAARVAARKKEVTQDLVSKVRRVRDQRIDGVLRAQHRLLELLDHDDPRIALAAAHQLHTQVGVFQAIQGEINVLHAAGELEHPGQAALPQGWKL